MKIVFFAPILVTMAPMLLCQLSQQLYQQQLLPPAGFVWQTAPGVFIGNGTAPVTYSFDVSSLAPASTATCYVNLNTGSDSNPCTLAAPCKSITHAYACGTAPTVHVAAAWYPFAYGASVSNQAPNKNVNLICDSPGQCILSADMALPAFAAVANHYEASVASPGCGQVIDALYTQTYTAPTGVAYTTYSQLTQVGSSITVDSTPGTWYWNSSTFVLYVHMSDGRAPDSYAHCEWLSKYSLVSYYGNTTYYATGFRIIGGEYPVFVAALINSASGPLTFILENSTIELSAVSAGAAFNVQGNANQPVYAYTQNDVCIFPSQDCYSYANFGTGASWAAGVFGLEIGNVGWHSVWPTTVTAQVASQNCTTSHGFCAIERVNPICGDTFGPVVGDVGGALGVFFGGSIYAAQAGSASGNFEVFSSGSNNSFDWLYGVNNGTVLSGQLIFESQPGSGYYQQYPLGLPSSTPVAYVNPTAPVLSIRNVIR